jgi:predicted kinase
MELSKFHDLDVVLVCGLPGAGKSHFAAEYFRDKGRNRVNRKELHRLLYEMIHFGGRWSEAKFDAIDEFLVKHVERKIIEHLLQNKQKVLIDNTSISAESRKSYLGIAHQLHKSIGVIFLHTPAATCLQRNRARADPVPERVISNLAAAIDLPRAEEGFREILILKGV